jgi:hypothetical protein
MARRIDCPFIPGAWIEIPDRWLGAHIDRRDEAGEKARELKLRPTAANFAVAIALMDDWHGLPGMDGKPDRWKFAEIDAGLIAWINGQVLGDYMTCFLSPAVYYSQSPTPTATEPETKALGA